MENIQRFGELVSVISHALDMCKVIKPQIFLFRNKGDGPDPDCSYTYLYFTLISPVSQGVNEVRVKHRMILRENVTNPWPIQQWEYLKCRQMISYADVMNIIFVYLYTLHQAQECRKNYSG